MGLSAILSPVVGYAIVALIVVAAIVGGYVAIRRKGELRERERQARLQARARDDMQRRLDDARDQELAIDDRARNEVDQLKTDAQRPSDTPPFKTGDRVRL